MKIIDFDVPDIEVRYFENEINRLSLYIKDKHELYPKKNFSEITDLLYKEINTIVNSLKKVVKSDDYLKYDTAKDFLEDDSLIMEVYNYIIKFDDYEQTIPNYSTCREENRLNYIKAKIKNIKNKKKENQDCIKKRIESDVNNDIVELGQKSKDEYIEILEKMLEFFDSHRCLQKYRKDERNFLNLIDCPEVYDMVFPDENIKNFVDKEKLEDIDLEKIRFLVMFWLNRFSKEVEGVANAVFAISNFNLSDKIFKNEEIDIEFEDLRKMLSKICNLNNQSRVGNSIKKKDKKKRYTKERKSENGKEYTLIFDNLLPKCNNNLVNNLNQYMTWDEPKRKIYQLKEKIAYEQIYSLMYNPNQVRNWGIIPNREIIDEKKKFCAIGIDVKGFIMPIRIHISKHELRRFLNREFNTSRIPVYSNSRDFFIENKYIRSPIVTLSNKDCVEYMKNKMENSDENDSNYKVYKYLLELYEPQEEIMEYNQTDYYNFEDNYIEHGGTAR